MIKNVCKWTKPINQHDENETISAETCSMSLQLTETPASQFTHGNNVINDHKTQLSNFQTFKASYKKGQKQQQQEKKRAEKS